MDIKELARRARAERRARKWTQAELAARVGVVTRTVSGFERHETTPQPETLRAIMELLGIEDERGEAAALETREGWPPEVAVFLDMMGLFLSRIPEAERLEVIHDVTRQIMGR